MEQKNISYLWNLTTKVTYLYRFRYPQRRKVKTMSWLSNVFLIPCLCFTSGQKNIINIHTTNMTLKVNTFLNGLKKHNIKLLLPWQFIPLYMNVNFIIKEIRIKWTHACTPCISNKHRRVQPPQDPNLYKSEK